MAMCYFPTLRVGASFDFSQDPASKCLRNNQLAYGGVHLPDLTVITPVFDSAEKEIVFWAASRGHHADVSVFFFLSSVLPQYHAR